jgi:ADP-ribose pyrophosphatase YjhB (NUDIX family)
MKKQPLTYDEFKLIFSKVPRLCVDLIIQSKQGLVLTLRKNHGWVGQWHLPGGTIHYREKVLDAVHRIASEELGIVVENEKMIGYLEYFSEEKERGFGYAVSLLFVCTTVYDKLILDGQASEAKFHTLLPSNVIVKQRDFLIQNKLLVARATSVTNK